MAGTLGPIPTDAGQRAATAEALAKSKRRHQHVGVDDAFPRGPATTGGALEPGTALTRSVSTAPDLAQIVRINSRRPPFPTVPGQNPDALAQYPDAVRLDMAVSGSPLDGLPKHQPLQPMTGEEMETLAASLNGAMRPLLLPEGFGLRSGPGLCFRYLGGPLCPRQDDWGAFLGGLNVGSARRSCPEFQTPTRMDLE